MKRHNRTQSLIDGETLKSGRSHGLFSYTFVREMCKNLGLKPSLTGSKEPADATPEDVDAFVSEVPKLFRDYKIDPRANLQFDEFNDIKGITQRRMITKTGKAIRIFGQKSQSQLVRLCSNIAPRPRAVGSRSVAVSCCHLHGWAGLVFLRISVLRRQKRLSKKSCPTM